MLKAPLVGEPGRYQILAYMERNTNFSIEAHTRPKRGTFFWLQVYERVWTSHKGVIRISSDPEIIE